MEFWIAEPSTVTDLKAEIKRAKTVDHYLSIRRIVERQREQHDPRERSLVGAHLMFMEGVIYTLGPFAKLAGGPRWDRDRIDSLGYATGLFGGALRLVDHFRNVNVHVVNPTVPVLPLDRLASDIGWEWSVAYSHLRRESPQKFTHQEMMISLERLGREQRAEISRIFRKEGRVVTSKFA